MTDPTLSVIIVTWNDWPKLQVCLNSIFNSELPPTEVVVIDNASVDGTRERIRERFPATRVCRNESNIGHTRAVNLGFSLARGEFILVLDSDTELTGDTVHRLLAFLRARPDVALLAPRTFNTDGTVQESAPAERIDAPVPEQSFLPALSRPQFSPSKRALSGWPGGRSVHVLPAKAAR